MIQFGKDGWKEYTQYWCKPENKKLLAKLNKIITESYRSPETGSGMPEQLKHDLSGW